MRWGTVVLGFAGLALLEAVVSSTAASGRVGGFLAKAGEAVHWFTSPAIPFFSTTKASHPAQAPASRAPATPAQITAFQHQFYGSKR